RIVLGGQHDRAENEIFGPILAIVPVPNISVALEYIRRHDSPLVLYAFSKDPKFRAYVRENTLSGMFVENDVIVHGASVVTPFGGVGGSGYGGYKGKYSYDLFSHAKPCFNSPKWRDTIAGLRFPPYTPAKLNRLKTFLLESVPYPRPGQPKPFNWTRLLVHAVLVGVLALNKDRLLAA
ncbi:hypothetical protein M422DRAFT_248908, partial [Sphaerobolus stellatus SS14]